MDKGKRQPAGKPGNKPELLSYRGHKIKLLDPGGAGMPMLSIDGNDIMIRREETGGYSAPMLNMFATYATLGELARQLIDISPVFLAQRRTKKSSAKGGVGHASSTKKRQ